MNHIYSNKIHRYADICQNKVLLPDNILIKEGIACGDNISILGEINENILEFKFVIDGCMQCKAMSGLIYFKYNQKNIDYVKKDSDILLKRILSDKDYILKEFDIDKDIVRLKCILSPLELFITFLDEITNLEIQVYDNEDTIKNLDCDACVSTSRINWNKNGDKIKKISSNKVVRTTEYRKNWMSVSKCYLNEKEKILLNKLYENMNNKDLEYIQHEKMEQMIYSNLIRYSDISEDIKWKEITYKIYRKFVVKIEIDKLVEYISKEKLNAAFVKGAANGELYDEDLVRVYLDYDIVCTTSKDAFKLGTYLFRNGFTIFTGVFSLKKIESQDYSLYSGHFHVQKLLQDQFKLIIDINFPAFPLGRVELFKPNIKNGKIDYEEQLIITLSHLFKHKDVFMKDINDIYLMIIKRNLDFTKLYNLIKHNNLHFYMSIALSYIIENYNLSEELKRRIQEYLHLDKDMYMDFSEWPYNIETVYKVKKYDLDSRLNNSIDNKRIYLFPLIIFTKLTILDIKNVIILRNKKYVITQLDSNMWKIEYGNIKMIFTGMGIFLDNTTNVSVMGRKKIRGILEEILSVCGIIDILEVPYITKNREEWYF